MKLRRKPRIICNDDSCTLRTAPPPHTVESLACALDYLKRTQVDCLCWCVGEQQIAYAWQPRPPAGRIPSGFLLRAHEIIELRVPGRELRDGENTLAFEMPKFPHERDPCVYIYELEADVGFR